MASRSTSTTMSSRARTTSFIRLKRSRPSRATNTCPACPPSRRPSRTSRGRSPWAPWPRRSNSLQRTITKFVHLSTVRPQNEHRYGAGGAYQHRVSYSLTSFLVSTMFNSLLDFWITLIFSLSSICYDVFRIACILPLSNFGGRYLLEIRPGLLVRGVGNQLMMNMSLTVTPFLVLVLFFSSFPFSPTCLERHRLSGSPHNGRLAPGKSWLNGRSGRIATEYWTRRARPVASGVLDARLLWICIGAVISRARGKHCIIVAKMAC